MKQNAHHVDTDDASSDNDNYDQCRPDTGGGRDKTRTETPPAAAPGAHAAAPATATAAPPAVAASQQQ